MGLYAGDISAAAAWEMLSADGKSTLVDVRTPQEWAVIGVPDLSKIKKQPLLLSWVNNDYSANGNFLGELEAQGFGKDDKLFFMCKGGGRSQAAAIAATAAGYKNAYNVANGFEAQSGWKASNLPYVKDEAKKA